jgi:hypothetical protein
MKKGVFVSTLTEAQGGTLSAIGGKPEGKMPYAVAHKGLDLKIRMSGRATTSTNGGHSNFRTEIVLHHLPYSLLHSI